MQFLNPYSILGINSSGGVIDAYALKRAKRKLLADFDLEDGKPIKINGIQVSKSDFILATDQLLDSTKNEFLLFLSEDTALNDFLTTGNINFFKNRFYRSIYNNYSFVDYIFPYFAHQYGKAFFLAYSSGDTYLISLLHNPPFPFSPPQNDALYKKTTSYIERLITEIKELNQDFNHERLNFEKANRIISGVNVDLINILPVYFKNAISSYASSLRNLAIAIFNNSDKSELAIRLINIVLRLQIPESLKEKFHNDYKQMSDIYRERQNTLKFQPTVEKYAKALSDLEKTSSDIDAGLINLTTVKTKLRNLVQIEEVNALPADLKELKDHVALYLRATSVSVWNKFYDAVYAIEILNHALKIDASVDIKNKLLSDKQALLKLNKSAPASVPQKESRDGVGIILIVGLSFLILIAIYTIDSAKRNINKHKQSTSAPSPVRSASPSLPGNTNGALEPAIPKYKGNQLVNGNSPYNAYFGKGVYDKNYQNWVEFQNGNKSDAVVCLVDVSTNRTIRNEYIRAGSSFQMTNIPNGTYYVKGFYGKDWNPEKLLDNGKVKGGFDTDFSFSKSDSRSDWITLEDNGYKYSTYSITLYTVTNGNMSQQNINEQEFF